MKLFGWGRGICRTINITPSAVVVKDLTMQPSKIVIKSPLRERMLPVIDAISQTFGDEVGLREAFVAGAQMGDLVNLEVCTK